MCPLFHFLCSNLKANPVHLCGICYGLWSFGRQNYCSFNVGNQISPRFGPKQPSSGKRLTIPIFDLHLQSFSGSEALKVKFGCIARFFTQLKTKKSRPSCSTITTTLTTSTGPTTRIRRRLGGSWRPTQSGARTASFGGVEFTREAQSIQINGLLTSCLYRVTCQVDN